MLDLQQLNRILQMKIIKQPLIEATKGQNVFLLLEFNSGTAGGNLSNTISFQARQTLLLYTINYDETKATLGNRTALP